MKIFKNKYPKGTFPYQQTDGRYIDKFLYENLKFLASKIGNDMTFLAVAFSSTLEVGTGKSVLMTQIGETWTALVNKIYGLDLQFNEENIVWHPKDLIQKSFKLPKYSFILLDEWEDAHYWSELGKYLRSYFRKCRQQNLFIGVIIPNYFQLNINYAIGRSIFAIDVKFNDELERGNYSFYDFKAKRDLYIRGKKFQDYRCIKPTFQGLFTDGYGVDRAKYLKAKLDDLKKWEVDESDKSPKLKPEQIANRSVCITLRRIFDNKKFLMKEGVNIKSLSKIFEIKVKQMEKKLTMGKEYIEEFKESSSPPANFTYTINQEEGVKKMEVSPPLLRYSNKKIIESLGKPME